MVDGVTMRFEILMRREIQTAILKCYSFLQCSKIKYLPIDYFKSNYGQFWNQQLNISEAFMTTMLVGQ